MGTLAVAEEQYFDEVDWSACDITHSDWVAANPEVGAQPDGVEVCSDGF